MKPFDALDIAPGWYLIKSEIFKIGGGLNFRYLLALGWAVVFSLGTGYFLVTTIASECSPYKQNNFQETRIEIDSLSSGLEKVCLDSTKCEVK